MSELDIYANGTFYNVGTHQREPVLHVRNGSVLGVPKGESAKRSGGGKSVSYFKGVEGNPAVLYVAVILLFIVIVLLYLIVAFSLKGVRHVKAKRARKLAEQQAGPKGPPPAPTPGQEHIVQPAPKRVELVWADQATREQAEAEAEWDRRLALAKRLI